VESNLSKLFIIAFSVISSLIVTGCQAKTEQVKEQEAPLLIAPSHTVPTSLIKKRPCKKSYSPPIKDIAKLKEMLMKSGRITSDMNNVEINKVVNQYVKNKRAAFKACKK
jgi:hypothetical protein